MDDDAMREHAVLTETIGHVTFYLVEDNPFDEMYFVYSESKERKLGPCPECSPYPLPYDLAVQEFRKAVQRLEQILERKREGMPTSIQLHFLFRHKIPIALDLTWGEASALIEECLNQIEDEKQEKQRALLDLFDGFAVKDKVVYKVNPRVAGTITKLYEIDNFKGAHVRLDRGGTVRDVPLGNLQKIREGQEMPPAPNAQFAPGDNVRHPIFGEGLVLKSEIEVRTEFVEVQFQGEHGKKRLCLDFAKLEKLAL